MSHEELKDLVMARRDGETLSPEAAAQAERHLTACEECRASVAAWDRASKALFAKRTLEPSEEFTRAVMRKVRSLPEPASWAERLGALFPRLVLAGAATAAAALLLLPGRAPQAPADQTVSVVEQAEAEDESAYGMLEAVPEETSGYGTAIEEYFL